MARQKYISDEDLINLFEQYLISHCSNDPNLVKISQFGNFVRKKGYPNVADTTIRRNTVFRQTLEFHKQEFEDDDYQTIITYKTLDVENFLAINRTPVALKSALVELNQYYKKIVDYATSFKQEADRLRAEVKILEAKNETLSKKLKDDRDLEHENKKLRSIVKTSIYPEIANELLKAEGLLKSDNQIITDEYLSNHIITADSEINFHDSTEQKDMGEQNKIISIKNMLDSKTKY
ncbi:hypothetical protein AB1I63_02840 [Streptococcus pneumoniae]